MWTYHDNFPPILHALLPESLHPLTYADNPGRILPPCSGTIGNLHIQMVKHPKTCTESQQLGCWKKCRSWSWVVKLGRWLLFPQSNSWFWPNLNMLWNIPRAIPSKWRLSMPQMQSSCFALCMARIIYHVGCQQSDAWKSRLCNDQNERNFHGAFIYSSLEKKCPRELMETAGAPSAIQGTRKQVNAEQTLVESQKCLRLWFSVLPSNNLQMHAREVLGLSPNTKLTPFSSRLYPQVTGDMLIFRIQFRIACASWKTTWIFSQLGSAFSTARATKVLVSNSRQMVNLSMV